MRDENWRADDATGCAWRQDETTVTVKVAPVRSLAMDRAERWDARGALGATRAGARARLIALASSTDEIRDDERRDVGASRAVGAAVLVARGFIRRRRDAHDDDRAHRARGDFPLR
jgi:hypothetical protein